MNNHIQPVYMELLFTEIPWDRFSREFITNSSPCKKKQLSKFWLCCYLSGYIEILFPIISCSLVVNLFYFVYHLWLAIVHVVFITYFIVSYSSVEGPILTSIEQFITIMPLSSFSQINFWTNKYLRFQKIKMKHKWTDFLKKEACSHV